VRGGDNRTGELFSCVDLETRLRRDHPLRAIWAIVNEALSPRSIRGLCDRRSPGKLMRTMLLQALYSIRSERLLMERLEQTCCSAGLSESALAIQPRTIRLLSSNPRAARASRQRDAAGAMPKQTFASTTDSDAKLCRKGKGTETNLCFIGHGLIENRLGLPVDALTPAGGHAERVAALHMIEPRADRPTTITVGADKAYDAEDFVNELRIDERDTACCTEHQRPQLCG
jgi:hypothetical protein